MAVEAEDTKEGPVTFHVDSTYAIKVATGEWRPRQRNAKARNGRLVRRLRNAYRDLTLARGTENIRIVHERAHVGTRGNEAADSLARKGASAADAREHHTLQEPKAEPVANTARPPGDPG